MKSIFEMITDMCVADGEEVQAGSDAMKDRIGRNEDESIDEIVISNVDLHIEQMGKKFWWMGIYKGDKRIAINIYSKKAITLYIDENELINE